MPLAFALRDIVADADVDRDSDADTEFVRDADALLDSQPLVDEDTVAVAGFVAIPDLLPLGDTVLSAVARDVPEFGTDWDWPRDVTGEFETEGVPVFAFEVRGVRDAGGDADVARDALADSDRNADGDCEVVCTTVSDGLDDPFEVAEGDGLWDGITETVALAALLTVELADTAEVVEPKKLRVNSGVLLDDGDTVAITVEPAVDEMLGDFEGATEGDEDPDASREGSDDADTPPDGDPV